MTTQVEFFAGVSQDTTQRDANILYCSQNNGDCATCALVNYGRDCRNNPVAITYDGDGTRCQCGRPATLCDKHAANHQASSIARLDASRHNTKRG